MASINSTGKLSIDIVTLQRITYSSYKILQHRRLQPDNGSVHLNVRQIISQKEVKFPTIHAIWLVELLHLFLQKLNFPYRIIVTKSYHSIHLRWEPPLNLSQ